MDTPKCTNWYGFAACSVRHIFGCVIVIDPKLWEDIEKATENLVNYQAKDSADILEGFLGDLWGGVGKKSFE